VGRLWGAAPEPYCGAPVDRLGPSSDLIEARWSERQGADEVARVVLRARRR
jgi:hypothetical protein